MLDAMFKVIEKLVELLSYRASLGRKAFEDHIEPLYRNVQIVVEDYLAFCHAGFLTTQSYPQILPFWGFLRLCPQCGE